MILMSFVPIIFFLSINDIMLMVHVTCVEWANCCVCAYQFHSADHTSFYFQLVTMAQDADPSNKRPLETEEPALEQQDEGV